MEEKSIIILIILALDLFFLVVYVGDGGSLETLLHGHTVFFVVVFLFFLL